MVLFAIYGLINGKRLILKYSKNRDKLFKLSMKIFLEINKN
jgi:hypothetical protein